MAESSVALPSAPAVQLAPNVVLQPPLSHHGHGPGLLIIVPASYAEAQKHNDTLDPEPLQKWAEEGYAVVRISLDLNNASGDAVTTASKDLADGVKMGLDALVALPECDVKDKVGAIVYGSRADYTSDFGDSLRATLASHEDIIVGTVVYDKWDLPPGKPVLYQFAGNNNSNNLPTDDIPKDGTVYSYPGTASAGFIIPGHPDFKISAAGVAHTRALTFLKKHTGGPYFDLEKVWEKHTFFEFGDRSVEKTMGTMVQEPYVNHVPTITGGIGRAQLTDFYRHHFIFSNPPDTELELVSRTIGVDRIIDEFVFSLTHDREVDWLLPGIPPTNKPLRIPFTSVVNIRGDRLYHEHISWDQATVLRQLGLLPEYLPFPYALPGGKLPAPGKRFEYRVPAAGAETAMKLKDEKAVPSNEVLRFGVGGAIREVDDT